MALLGHFALICGPNVPKSAQGAIFLTNHKLCRTYSHVKSNFKGGVETAFFDQRPPSGPFRPFCVNVWLEWTKIRQKGQFFD